MALDPFLKGDVPDVQICTISISYERTLEENLYAYEVLGIPKPKETTTGFLAAIDKIRGENFGRIYVHVNEPISVRDHLNRRIPKWYLPSFRVDLDEEQQKEIHDLSHHLVCRQQSSAITPVFAVVSVLLSTGRFGFQQLQEHFLKLNSLVAAYGTPCLIQNDLQKILEESLLVHKNKIRYTDGKFYYHFDPATTSGKFCSTFIHDCIM
jgi:glyceronephosphate O-acyltransferase